MAPTASDSFLLAQNPHPVLNLAHHTAIRVHSSPGIIEESDSSSAAGRVRLFTFALQ
jgi:hypothetical protein